LKAAISDLNLEIHHTNNIECTPRLIGSRQTSNLKGIEAFIQRTWMVGRNILGGDGLETVNRNLSILGGNPQQFAALDLLKNN
jgi:hypothetical protein